MDFRKYFAVFLVVLLACCAVGNTQRVYLDPFSSVPWGGTCSGCDTSSPCTLTMATAANADCELVFIAGGDWTTYSPTIYFSGSLVINVTADGGQITSFSSFSINAPDAVINVRDMAATSATVQRWSLIGAQVRVDNVNLTRIGIQGTTTKFSMVDSQIIASEENYDDGILQYNSPTASMVVTEFERVVIEVNRYLFSPSSQNMNVTISNSNIRALVTRSTALAVFNVYDSTFDAPINANRNFIPYGPTSSLIFHRSRFTNYGSMGAVAWANTPVQPTTAEIIGCQFTDFIIITQPSTSMRIEDTTFTHGFNVQSLNLDSVPAVILKNVHFVLSGTGMTDWFVSLFSSAPKTVTWENVRFTTSQPPNLGELKLNSNEANFTSSTTFPTLVLAGGEINCEDCDFHFNSSIKPFDYEESGAKVVMNARHIVFDHINVQDTGITTGATTEVTCNLADLTNGCIKLVTGGAIEGPYLINIAHGRLNVDLSALGFSATNSPRLGDTHYLFNSLDRHLELVDTSGLFNLTIAVNDTTQQASYRFSPIACHTNCVAYHQDGPCISNQWCPCLPGASGTYCENGNVGGPTTGTPTSPSTPASNASRNAFFGTFLVALFSIFVALL